MFAQLGTLALPGLCGEEDNDDDGHDGDDDIVDRVDDDDDDMIVVMMCITSIVDSHDGDCALHLS